MSYVIYYYYWKLKKSKYKVITSNTSQPRECSTVTFLDVVVQTGQLLDSNQMGKYNVYVSRDVSLFSDIPNLAR